MLLEEDRLKFKYVVSPLIMFSYFLFVYSIPFEVLSGVMYLGLAKITGYLFMMTTFVQPQLCYSRPHKSFWYFLAWIAVYLLSGLLTDPMRIGIIDPYAISRILIKLTQYVQLLVLFWISFNIMRYKSVINGAMMSLAAAGISVVLLNKFGIGVSFQQSYEFERQTIFGFNSNTYGNMLAISFIALVGLGYGRVGQNRIAKALIWGSAGLLILQIAQTGSRTATLSVFAGLLPYIVLRIGKISRWRTKIVVIFIILISIFIFFQVDVSHKRWEKTFLEGHSAGRKEIFSAAWHVFLDNPIIGAGPLNNLYLVGMEAYGIQRILDTHNMYLWILSELGLLGAIPFFMGLYFCAQSAWRARNGPQGIMPIALMMTILTMNLTLSWHTRKMLWVVLSYAAASDFFLSKMVKKSYSPPVVLK